MYVLLSRRRFPEYDLCTPMIHVRPLKKGVCRVHAADLFTSITLRSLRKHSKQNFGTHLITFVQSP